jgi:hypothetical protein
MHLLNAIRVIEDAPSASKAAFGISVPIRDFAIPAPPRDISADDVSVKVQTRGTHGLPLASPRVIRWLWSQLEREPVGQPSYDDEGRERRVRALKAYLTELPAEVRPEHAPFVVGHLAHLATGAYGLRVEDAVEAMTIRGYSPADVETWARAAIEGGTFYPFDVAGRELDEQAAEAKAEVERQAAEVAKVEAEDTSPNEKTLDELGWLGFEVSDSAGADVPLHLSGKSRLRAGDKSYALVPRAAIAGAHIPEGTVVLGVEVLPGDFVLPLMKRELDAIVAREPRHLAAAIDPRGAIAHGVTMAHWILDKVRPARGVDTSAHPRAVEHDESTVDGRYRAELLEFLARDEFLPSHAGATFDSRMHILFHAGVYGLSLADDVVASALHRRIRDCWSRACAKPAGWDRNEAEKAKTTSLRNSLTGPGAPYVAKAWTPPPLPAWCATEDVLLEKYRTKRHAFAKPFFCVDELYAPPSPSLVGRLLSVFRTGDPWTPTIEAFVEGKDVVRSGDIEAALLAAGDVALTPLHGPIAQRVFRIMTKSGWRKTDRVIDGRKVKCWVRA